MRVRFCFTTFAAVATSLAWAAAVSPAPSDPRPVTLDGHVLFTIKASRAQYTAEQRARDTSSSLLAVAADRQVPADALRWIREDTDTILLAGRTFLMAVTDDDARLENSTREQLAGEWGQIITRAIAAYRHRRAPWIIARNVALAIGCWVIVAAVLMALRLGVRKAGAALADRSHRFFTSRTLDALHQHFARQLYPIAGAVVKVLAVTLAVLVVSIGAFYSLGRFPETSGVSRYVLDALWSAAAHSGRAFVAYLPNLLVILFVAAGTHCAIRILRAVANAVATGAITIPGFAAEWATPTNRIFAFVLVVIALVVIFPYLPGGDSPAFRGISIFIGVLVSLGSSSAMGNLIAGVILTYMRPFRVGDRVKISDTVGDVLERSFLVTRLRTIKNVEIVVPNSMILGAHILNYSLQANGAGLIVHTSITIGYDTPWATVHRLLIDAALSTRGVLNEPWPFVHQTSLNDSHVTYQINAFTRSANQMEAIVAELHRRIQDEFNKAGVEIMSPSYLSLRDGNAVAMPAADWPANRADRAFRVRVESNDDTHSRAPYAHDVLHG